MWRVSMKVSVLVTVFCIMIICVLLYGQSKGNQTKSQSLTKDTTCTPLLDVEELEKMDFGEVAEIYHGYINSIQIHCRNRVRVGHLGDGGWDVCLDPPYQLNSSCLVYSFGIGNEWSFDDEVVLRYGCEVYAYDPSMTKVEEHDRKKKIHFRRTGINGTDGVNGKGWRMRTFSSILKENGHLDSVIDVLKLDVEHSEWFAFPEMSQSRSLKNVKQICFEIHLQNPYDNKQHYIKGLQILKNIYKEGFRIFHSNRNRGTLFHPFVRSFIRLTRAGCHELCMIKDVSYLNR